MKIKLYARFIGPTLEQAKIEREATWARIRSRQEIPADQYPALPWCMADLPGSVWRNVHTAGLVTVQCLGENRFGRLGPDPGMASMFSIGLWRGERFCIEHWIRVDLQPVEEQFAWAKERVVVCRADLRRAKAALEKARREGRRTGLVKYQVEGREDVLKDAQQALVAFCEKADIELEPGVLFNLGIVPGEQIQMF